MLGCSGLTAPWVWGLGCGACLASHACPHLGRPAPHPAQPSAGTWKTTRCAPSTTTTWGRQRWADGWARAAQLSQPPCPGSAAPAAAAGQSCTGSPAPPRPRVLLSRAPPPTPPTARLQVWYGVPSSATLALEEAVRDALPHLAEGNPRLLYQLVTMLSPLELQVRGIWRGGLGLPSLGLLSLGQGLASLRTHAHLLPAVLAPARCTPPPWRARCAAAASAHLISARAPCPCPCPRFACRRSGACLCTEWCTSRAPSSSPCQTPTTPASTPASTWQR